MDNEEHKIRTQKHKEAFERKKAAAKQEKGLIIIHTGTGKGKTTAAFGMGVRILGHGLNLGVVQFIKGAHFTAEREFLGGHPNCDFFTMGEGYTWNTQDLEKDKATALAGWEQAEELINSGKYQMVILDELNVVLKYNYVPMERVLAVLQNKDPNLHVVITGRHACAELIDIADLVSESKPIKHPYKEQGIKAQRGVEF